MPEVTNKEPIESEEVLEPNARNIILSIISQLSKGSDLQRITLPTFILEPRSFLERLTDFLSYPELFLGAHQLVTPEERLVALTKFYLSGWHIRPKGVRKPYNPVLGEFFRCKWKYPNGTTGYYIAEQVSHHPPISVYMFVSPENQFRIEGEMKPKSKFYGTSVATHLNGISRITFLDRPNEEYILTYPSIHAYGILFGKLTYELGDSVTIKCATTELQCKVDFKTKGLFSGAYNTLSGKIETTSGTTLYDLSGNWSDKIFIKEEAGSKKVFYDARAAEIHPRVITPISDQHEFESQKLWQLVTENLKKKSSCCRY